MWLYQFQHDDSHQLAPGHSPVNAWQCFVQLYYIRVTRVV